MKQTDWNAYAKHCNELKINHLQNTTDIDKKIRALHHQIQTAYHKATHTTTSQTNAPPWTHYYKTSYKKGIGTEEFVKELVTSPASSTKTCFFFTIRKRIVETRNLAGQAFLYQENGLYLLANL